MSLSSMDVIRRGQVPKFASRFAVEWPPTWIELNQSMRPSPAVLATKLGRLELSRIKKIKIKMANLL